MHRTFHYFLNRFPTLVSNLLSGIYLSDMDACYKAARVYELPITYYPRTRSAGKKIGWTDGVAALGYLVFFNVLISRRAAFETLPERYRPTS